MRDNAKGFIDLASAVNVVAVLANVLPAVAALFTIVWTFFRTLETPAFQAMCFRAFGWRVDQWLHLPKRDDDL